MKKFILVASFLLFSSSIFAQNQILVSVAASLTDVMTAIGKRFESNYPGSKVLFNFGPSGQFKAQIEKGAPVDLFVTAKASQLDELIKQELALPEQKLILAYNSLVAISPVSSSDPAFGGHSTFLRALSSKQRYKLAVGTPKVVPAGDYAQELFQSLSIQDEVKEHLVFGNSVRQVLDYAVRGEVDFAIVYLTDALKRKEKVRIVEKFPSFGHSPIVYGAIVIKNTKNKQLALNFLKFLSSKETHSILESNGFSIRP